MGDPTTCGLCGVICDESLENEIEGQCNKCGADICGRCRKECKKTCKYQPETVDYDYCYFEECLRCHSKSINKCKKTLKLISDMTEEDVSYLSMIMSVSKDKDDVIKFLRKILRKNGDEDQKRWDEDQKSEEDKKADIERDEKQRTISGKEFNSLFSQHKFCKILHETLNHNGFQYKEGLNIDSEEFYPHDECEKGGLYFAMEEHILLYTEYGSKIAMVSIPDDAMVYIEKEKFKSNKIILSDIIPLDQYPPFMRQDASLRDSVLTAQNFPEKWFSI